MLFELPEDLKGRDEIQNGKIEVHEGGDNECVEERYYDDAEQENEQPEASHRGVRQQLLEIVAGEREHGADHHGDGPRGAEQNVPLRAEPEHRV